MHYLNYSYFPDQDMYMLELKKLWFVLKDSEKVQNLQLYC